MKGESRSIFALISLGIIMLVLLLAPQATKSENWKSAAWLHADSDPDPDHRQRQ